MSQFVTYINLNLDVTKIESQSDKPNPSRRPKAAFDMKSKMEEYIKALIMAVKVPNEFHKRKVIRLKPICDVMLEGKKKDNKKQINNENSDDNGVQETVGIKFIHELIALFDQTNEGVDDKIHVRVFPFDYICPLGRKTVGDIIKEEGYQYLFEGESK